MAPFAKQIFSSESCATLHKYSQQINHVKPLAFSDVWEDPQQHVCWQSNPPTTWFCKIQLWAGSWVQREERERIQKFLKHCSKFLWFQKMSKVNHSVILNNPYFKMFSLRKQNSSVFCCLWGFKWFQSYLQVFLVSSETLTSQNDIFLLLQHHFLSETLIW